MLFEPLVDRLRTEGFSIGVDHYLRLQRLLERMPPGDDPERLKRLLCPIFATSERQQQRFSAIFDEFWPSALERVPSAPPPDPRPPPLPVSGQRWPYLLAAAAASAVLVAFLWWRQPAVVPAPKQSQEPGAAAPSVVADFVQVTPTVRTVRISITVAPPGWIAAYRRWRPVLLWGGTGVPLLLWAFYEMYRYRRRRLLLQRQRGKGPPDRFVLEAGAPELRLYATRQFRDMARKMATRAETAVARLDVGRSVARTAAEGSPQLVYAPEKRTPEYLLLIDRQSVRDHQCRLYREFGQALRERDIPVSLFTFDGDPRVCHDELTGTWLNLSALQSRFGEARLMLAGSGEGLLDPFLGTLFGWTKAFASWPHAWLLTPEALGSWTSREKTLAELFTVVPGTMAGLHAFMEGEAAERLVPGSRLPDLDEDADPAELLAGLRDYLGAEAFRWLCACAVYPELHWGLTLRLAELPELSGGRVLTEENLLKLARLPWFRAGAFPDELQLLLLQQLAPDIENAARQSVIEAMQRNLAPEGSRARERQEMEIRYQAGWLARAWRVLRRGVRDAAESGVAQDYVAVRSVESLQQSPLQFLLPRRLHAMFFERGLPLLGPRMAVRGVLALVVAGVALFGVWRADARVENLAAARVEWEERYVLIPAGTFQMGCSEGDSECSDYEKPAHRVTISRDFWIGETDVTVGNYRKFIQAVGKPMLYSPSFNEGWREEKQPIVNVNWYDAKAYCEWATQGKGGLPTEAQWEYAARGRVAAARYGPADEIGWYFQNSGGRAHEVGQKMPNAYGAYDMLGNVLEWTADWYGEYSPGAITDPPGPDRGHVRVLRGGSWFDDVTGLRAAGRDWDRPDGWNDYYGFRCAREVFP